MSLPGWVPVRPSLAGRTANGTPQLARHGLPDLAVTAERATGIDAHHLAGAQCMAVARSLRAAVTPDPRANGVPSTKGVL